MVQGHLSDVTSSWLLALPGRDCLFTYVCASPGAICTCPGRRPLGAAAVELSGSRSDSMDVHFLSPSQPSSVACRDRNNQEFAVAGSDSAAEAGDICTGNVPSLLHHVLQNRGPWLCLACTKGRVATAAHGWAESDGNSQGSQAEAATASLQEARQVALPSFHSVRGLGWVSLWHWRHSQRSTWCVGVCCVTLSWAVCPQHGQHLCMDHEPRDFGACRRRSPDDRRSISVSVILRVGVQDPDLPCH